MNDNIVKVLGLRYVLDESKDKFVEKGVFFDRPYNFPDHQTLFNSLESFVASLPSSERYNLHYTLNHLPPEAKSRKNFAKFEVVPFDFDLIDTSRREEYIVTFEEVLNITRDKFAIIDSGYGLHFIFKLSTPIWTVEELKSLQKSYVILCEKIEQALSDRGLIVNIKVSHKDKEEKTNVDKQVFRVGTLRLPGTKNVKFDKEGIVVEGSERECKFITRTMQPVSLSDLGLYADSKRVSQNTLGDKYWSQTDSQYVFEQCGALKEFKDSKGNVSYGKWFNAASIIPRFNDIDGRKLFHTISSGHPKYDYAETEELIDNALKNSGPHKCDTFRKNYDVCKSCKLSCTTPIQLREKSVLSYESTGFHKRTENGRWVPYFREIITKIGQEYNYRVTGEKSVYKYVADKFIWEKWSVVDRRAYIAGLLRSKPGDMAPTKTVNEAFNSMLNENVDEKLLSVSQGKINFQNGWAEVIDDKFVFTPHTPDSFKQGFLYCLPFNYDESLEAPQFEQFLNEIMLGREGLVQSLKEFLGYAMSNDACWADKALILKGTGANGKSVLLDVIKALIGEGNYSVVNMKTLRDVEARSALVGKIANISDESPKDSLIDAEDFKLLVTGGEFEYRVLYEGRNMARNRAKFIFSTNNELNFSDKSSAVARRLLVIPFDANFNPDNGPLTKEIDPFLATKLKSELGGIFNICMKAYIEAKKRRAIFVSSESRDILKEIEYSSNPIKAYIKDHIDTDSFKDIIPDAEYEMWSSGCESISSVPFNDIYEDFVAFCSSQGIKSQFTKINFGRLLKTELGQYVPFHLRSTTLGRVKRIKKATSVVYVLRWDPFSANQDY